MSVPCTVSIAVLLSTSGDPSASHNILVLLYSDDTLTDRFLLNAFGSSAKVISCINPLLVTDSEDAELLLTVYSTA